MRIFYSLIIGLVFATCTSKPELPKVGTWRAVIEMQGQQLPFNLTVAADSTGGLDAFVKNAAENLLLDEINLIGDSVEMALHIFDAKLKAKVNGDSLNGFFIINYTAGYRLPFKAAFGQDFRFVKTDRSLTVPDFSGKYAVQFFNDKDTSKAIAIFTQQGNYAEGTFLTPTGDYRYLEGNIVDDALHLSTFDGNHLYLFKVTKLNDSTLAGQQWLGRGRHRLWEGEKNPNASLPDPESLTYMKKGFDKLDFSFPDVDGKLVSLMDEKYKNKVVILQLLGSWCPNCMDETKFLVPWYEKNKSRGVEILGLAYERKPDFAYGRERVRKMKEKMNIGYDVVVAGVSDNAKALETLPQLNQFPGWPMTIFIGKDGKVKHIHTGFSGPGTGIYYEEHVQRFNSIVSELLAEDSALPSEKK
jgi:thiol-disulfide isomerase/thioredoxin